MARWNDGSRWNDGTLWTDSSAQPNPKPKKHKTVKRQDYFPIRIGNQIVWLRNAKTKLPLHTATLGLDAGEVTTFLLEVDNCIYALDSYRGALETSKDAAYQRIDDALYNDTLLPDITWLGFAPPAGAPTAVAYGALKRVFDYINNTIKLAAAYDMAIGEDLGIEGSVMTAPNPATTTPDFSLRATSGGKLEIVWTKGVFDGVKLAFDLGGGVTQNDFDLSPNYTLNWLPATGQVAMIKVRLLYLYKGADFGNWSAWQNWTLTNA